ncbi:MAG: ABC transporter ATP-binding protein/permease [Clostridiales bacterium]|jgi:ATP-binding cassette subfamily B protein|nr:ABC transporter ATP-binding protein/permease [Clostridiales bacterium]
MRIIGYLKKSLGAVGLIALLLLVQVVCDLSLPAYTAEIVDVGILRSGIPDADARDIQAVRAEYLARGEDVDAIQLSFMRGVGGKMLGLTLISALAAALVGLLASRAAARVGRDLRGRLYEKTISFSSVELDRFTAASLITRNTNDIQQVQMVSNFLLRVVLYAPMLGIGGVVRILGTHTGMAWIVAVAVAMVVGLVAGLFRATMPRFQMLQKLIDRVNLVSREILTGLSVIRAFGRERHEEARFSAASGDLMRTQLFVNRAMSLMMPLMMLIMNFVTIGIVWFGARAADLGSLELGDMIAFITYTMQIIMSFMMLSMISIMLPRANVAAERIDEVLNTEFSVVDAPRAELLNEDRPVADWAGELVFDNVSFRFPGAAEDVLRHISFTARPGETTAVIGSTGSGKSTLVNLIPRFYDVTGGRITIDGVGIRAMSQHKLRSLIGFVPQQGILFSGDVESNLKFGNSEISDADMERAAKTAQASEFIEGREGGFKSQVAQGGGNVSGGQKQRLSIARAIAKRPRIFVFDDSFSALDYKTDAQLRRALRETMRDTTVLIVAQRISTVLRADRILVLNQGELVGSGTHEELMQSCATYIEIAQSQLSERELGLRPADPIGGERR